MFLCIFINNFENKNHSTSGPYKVRATGQDLSYGPEFTWLLKAEPIGKDGEEKILDQALSSVVHSLEHLKYDYGWAHKHKMYTKIWGLFK